MLIIDYGQRWTLHDLHSEDEDPEYKPLRMPFKDDLDDFTNSPLDDKEDAVEGDTEGDLHVSKSQLKETRKTIVLVIIGVLFQFLAKGKSCSNKFSKDSQKWMNTLFITVEKNCINERIKFSFRPKQERNKRKISTKFTFI